ncbi:hypothetical protein [Streptomyces sp. HUAS TT7]|uniref:hypothetical protein n=1 Tax=Streptomyces sp. HUAS TT7 TaxID=3447507 RepID=UPI003F659964
MPERAEEYTVKVDAWYRKDGGTHEYATVPANATLGLFNSSTVLCEDDQDKDWNDTVIQLTWWSPPAWVARLRLTDESSSPACR